MYDTHTLLTRLIAAGILLLICFPVHEFAHAWVANLQGDATAKLFGRMTLNPVVHFDRMGSLMVLVSVMLGGVIIGWAKPTPVNTANLRDRRNGEVYVALAGPASNLLMALAGGLVVRLGHTLLAGPALEVLSYFVLFNVLLGLFNLLPIPPLDGSTLLFRVLSPRQVWQVRPFLMQYGLFILIGVVIVLGPYLAGVVFDVQNLLVGR